MLQVLFLLFYTLFGLDNAQYVWLNIPISNTQTFSFICVEIINGTSSVVLLLQYNTGSVKIMVGQKLHLRAIKRHQIKF